MRKAVYSESIGVTSNLGQSSQTQMRYGTVTKDTWEDSSGKKYVEVLLDGSDEPVTLSCDSTLKIGDRVSVFITGTNAMVTPLTDRILEDALNASSIEISKTATEIKKEFDYYYQTVDGEIEKIDSYIRETAYGIEVGRDSGQYRALVNSKGSFDILDTTGSTVVSMSVLSGRARLISPDFSSVALVSMGGSSVTCDSSTIKLSTNAGKILKDCGLTQTDSFDTGTNLSKTNVPGCILLYSGSTTGSVSLKVSSSYLAMITIVYSDGTRQMSQTVYSPGGKSVALFRSVPSGTTTFLGSEIVTISGSSISRGSGGQSILYNGGGIEGSTSSPFTIRYVIGWTG